MAELKDVLGAVLRDVAHSRVISDMFSRDVSLEYEKDPILGAFPVPRLQIKEASIQLRFAVNTVGRKEVDVPAIRRAQVARSSENLGKAVFADFILNQPNREELLKIITDKGLQLESALSAVMAKAVEASPQMVDAALGRKPETLVRKLQTELSRTLLEDPDVKKVLTRSLRAGPIKEKLQERIGATVAQFGEELSSALQAAERQALSVDVAVTKKDLAEVPEPLVSQINVVTEIRNYEWTEVGEEDGRPVRRLRPE
jgi:hypothetical protein